MNQSLNHDKQPNPYESIAEADALDESPATSGEVATRLLLLAFLLPTVAFVVYLALDTLALRELPWSGTARGQDALNAVPQSLPITHSEFDIIAWLGVFLVTAAALYRGRTALANRRWPKLVFWSIMGLAAIECLWFSTIFANSRY